MREPGHRNNLFPVFLNTENLCILIVGGGHVAADKIHFLLKSSPNARIKIVAPLVSDDILQLIKSNGQVTLLQRKFKSGDLENTDIIFLATNDPALNIKIFKLAHKKNILVNTADVPSLCDFFLGSIVTRGDLKIAFSTNGASPVLARRLREYFEDCLPDETEEILENLASIRKQLMGDFRERLKTLNDVTLNMVRNND